MSNEKYDYVVVGAGAAGCVLANRLSGDPGRSVALLEAGQPDKAREIHIPAAFSKLFAGPYDWNYHTSKQAQLADRELFWPRGKTLGGSTAINGTMWVRGHQADYDSWGRSARAGPMRTCCPTSTGSSTGPARRPSTAATVHCGFRTCARPTRPRSRSWPPAPSSA